MIANGKTDTMRMKAILVVAATAAFVSAPIWTSGFGGYDPDAFPRPQVDPPVHPAGYAFAIWGAIYLWLLVSAVYGLVKRADFDDWDVVRWPLAASLAIGTPWISVARTDPILATLMIILMAFVALWALLRTPVWDHWLLRAPLGLYAGWLVAAALVSFALVGDGYGFGFGPTRWAWGVLLGALFCGLYVLRVLPAPTFGLGISWALVGISVRNWGEDWSLVAASLAVAAVVAGYGFRRYF